MTNLDRPKKQRHHFTDKGPYRQSYGFSNSHVWMWELDHKEVWSPKNWCFQTVVLEKTLESPLDCKESKQINPKYSLEGLMPRLKLQYFGHLMRTADLLEKTLMLGKIEGWKRRGQQKTRWLDGIVNPMDMRLSKFWKMVKNREAWYTYIPWGCKESDTTEQLNNNNHIIHKSLK